MGIDSDGIPYYSNEGSEADYGDAMALLRSQAGLNRTTGTSSPLQGQQYSTHGTFCRWKQSELPTGRQVYRATRTTERSVVRRLSALERYRCQNAVQVRIHGNQQRYAETVEVWVSLDVNTGIVTLSANAVRIAIETGETDATFQNVRYPASLYLRTAYRVRLTPFGVPYHRGYRKATGYSLGNTGRRDSPGRCSTDSDSAVHERLSGRWNAVDSHKQCDGHRHNSGKHGNRRPEAVRESSCPAKRVYTPSLIVNTDGKVRQITYDCYVGRPAKTTVSIGAEYDRGQAPAFLRERRIREQKKLEEQSKSFVSNNDKRDCQRDTEVIQPAFPVRLT